MYYTDIDGNKVLDATAGLWCCNAGHGRKEISEAVSKQIKEMDYAPPSKWVTLSPLNLPSA